MAKVKTDVTQTYLDQLPAGYTDNHVNVALSAGSVVATVVITPVTSSDANALQTTVQNAKSAVQNAVQTKMKSLPNIATYLDAGKSVSDLTAVQETVVATAVTTTLTTTKAPTTKATTTTTKATTTTTKVTTAISFATYTIKPSTGNCPSGDQLSESECAFLDSKVIDGKTVKYKSADFFANPESCGCYFNRASEVYYNRRTVACNQSDAGEISICKGNKATTTLATTTVQETSGASAFGAVVLKAFLIGCIILQCGRGAAQAGLG
jgi:hypothetical protein